MVRREEKKSKGGRGKRGGGSSKERTERRSCAVSRNWLLRGGEWVKGAGCHPGSWGWSFWTGRGPSGGAASAGDKAMFVFTHQCWERAPSGGDYKSFSCAPSCPTTQSDPPLPAQAVHWEHGWWDSVNVSWMTQEEWTVQPNLDSRGTATTGRKANQQVKDIELVWSEKTIYLMPYIRTYLHL